MQIGSFPNLMRNIPEKNGNNFRASGHLCGEFTGHRSPVLLNGTKHDLGHGWLVIISDTLLVVMFYWNNMFNESSKGEWIDTFISLYLYVCFLVR